MKIWAGMILGGVCACPIHVQDEACLAATYV